MYDTSLPEYAISLEPPADFYFDDFKNDFHENVALDEHQNCNLMTPLDTQDLCVPIDNVCNDNFEIDSSINYIKQAHNSETAMPIDTLSI